MCGIAIVHIEFYYILIDKMMNAFVCLFVVCFCVSGEFSGMGCCFLLGFLFSFVCVCVVVVVVVVVVVGGGGFVVKTNIYI